MGSCWESVVAQRRHIHYLLSLRRACSWNMQVKERIFASHVDNVVGARSPHTFPGALLPTAPEIATRNSCRKSGGIVQQMASKPLPRRTADSESWDGEVVAAELSPAPRPLSAPAMHVCRILTAGCKNNSASI
jgi:hypothetical protein